ncbi:MAG: type II secretion system F family protein [Cellvibrionales bacterium]|jgi:type IV pilus assembly protein PilC|nr:type II secretion system F family protein [Cellvibrionales bacterium]HRF88101.1 type II secretion system F family protein [Pseudomonadales bacterium]HRG50151.1 type II secretion system F family protein [Pseudomonadales bacterium]
MATATTTKKPAAKTAVKKPKVKEPDIFLWEFKNPKGQMVRGEVKAQTLTDAKAQVRKLGYTNPKIKKKPKPLFGGGGKAIKPADIAVFTRQLATMMKAGVPLVQSFDLVADGLENANMKKIVIGVRDEVSGGGSFGGALRKYPKYFDDLFCSLVESGEQSGSLETMLDRVATYKEKTEALKKKIKKALTYPIAVLCVAFIVTGILLVKVVPVFANTFSSFGASLPAFTLFVLNLSELAQEYWFIILASAIAGFIAFSKAKENSPAFADAVDHFSLKIPIVGMIINEAVVARMARTLSTTFSAGVPLVEALDSVSGAAGNALYRDAIKRVRDEVTGGTMINVAFRSAGVFPTLLIQMTAIGEESGALDTMLEKVATHYEAEVDNKVDNLTSLLEPMIMSVLGILVGGLMIAMYLPIFQLGSVV